jgi:UDP:flavonoid glycosyltransferase YjiC (YdhE family)
MRVLLSTTSGAGHFRPLLPFARALERAGHEVACAAPAEAAAMVEREGLRHLPFDGVPGDHPDRLAVMAQLPVLPQHEAEELMGREVFGRLNTSFALPGAQAAVASFAPDLVLHDGAEQAARFAAEAAGLPVVAVNPSLAHPAYVESSARGTAGIRASLGLPADPDGQRQLHAPTLSLFPAVFDRPSAAELDLRRHRDAGLPPAGSRRELVYVTLGSEARSLPFFAPVLRDAVAGAVTAGLPVVVSTGGETDPGLLDDIDGDVTVEAWVDQAELLTRTAAVVHHGGSGTTLGALAAGVPMVVVPLFADQPYNAERVEATGCGVRADPGPGLADRVAAGVRAVVAEVPAGSAEMAAAVAALPVADEAVAWLEGLTRG